jgi:hypothetical protein
MVTKKMMMMMMVAVGALVVVLVGANVHAGDEMPRSGFLSDETYNKMQPDPDKRVDWLYTNPEADVSKYNKIMLDYVQFVFNDDDGYNGIQADELVVLAEAFHRAIISELSEQFEFTSSPGPGVLRLRLALTNVRAGRPVAGTVTTVVPVGLALSAVKKGVTGSHIAVGAASFEGAMIDTETGELMGAAIDTREGKKYQVSQSLSRWGHVKGAFEYWAKSLATRLRDFASKSKQD